MNYNKIIAWAPCWICYWTGDLFSKGLQWDVLSEDHGEDTWAWKWRWWVIGFFYNPYQILMNWSVKLSDWGGLNVWEKVDDDEESDFTVATLVKDEDESNN